MARAILALCASIFFVSGTALADPTPTPSPSASPTPHPKCAKLAAKKTKKEEAIVKVTGRSEAKIEKIENKLETKTNKLNGQIANIESAMAGLSCGTSSTQ